MVGDGQVFAKFWNFTKTDLGRMLLGFFLTTVVGGALVARYQQQNWQKQTELDYSLQQRQWIRDKQFEVERQRMQWEKDRRFEMLKRRLERVEPIVDELADLMKIRILGLRSVFDSVIAHDGPAAAIRWQTYMEAVRQWNAKLSSNRSKLARLVSVDTAEELHNNETDLPDKVMNPTSVHGCFFVVHRRLEPMVKCVQTPSCEVSVTDRRALAVLLDGLDVKADTFVNHLTDEVMGRETELTPIALKQ
jgi:hypothetical protein